MKVHPPKDAQRIYGVADLPQCREPATYTICDGDSHPCRVLLDKRKRQILELLTQGPVYCASPVRISDVVHIMKREIELDVKTEWFRGDRKTGAGDYGIYFLKSRVTPVAPQARGEAA